MILTSKFFFSAVIFILFVFSDRPEMGENSHELAEIHSVVVAIGEKCIDNAITERVNSQFWNSEKIISR